MSRADELVTRMKELQSRLEGAPVVTPARARESLARLVNSHFRNRDEHARFSVPADPQRDDDLMLEAFITRSELAEALLSLVCAAAEDVASALESVAGEAHATYLDRLREALAEAGQ